MIPVRFIVAYWKYCLITLAALLFHFVFVWTIAHYHGWYSLEVEDFTRSMLFMMVLCLIPAGVEGFPYEVQK